MRIEESSGPTWRSKVFYPIDGRKDKIIIHQRSDPEGLHWLAPIVQLRPRAGMPLMDAITFAQAVPEITSHFLMWSEDTDKEVTPLTP